MKTSISALVLLAVPIIGFAANKEIMCNAEICPPGTKVKTYYSEKNGEIFHICDTKEKAEYVSAVTGMIAMHVAFSGHMPNISPVTGDPEYPENDGKPNETNIFLKILREKSGVKSFDDALSKCLKGINKLNGLILETPEDSTVALTKISYKGTDIKGWMPINMMNKESK